MGIQKPQPCYFWRLCLVATQKISILSTCIRALWEFGQAPPWQSIVSWTAIYCSSGQPNRHGPNGTDHTCTDYWKRWVGPRHSCSTSLESLLCGSLLMMMLWGESSHSQVGNGASGEEYHVDPLLIEDCPRTTTPIGSGKTSFIYQLRQ